MYPGPSGGPDVPSAIEAYPTLASNAGRLARSGSDYVSDDAQRLSSSAMGFAPLINALATGTLNALSGGGFGRNFNASQLARLKVQQQELINRAEIVHQRHSDELLDYADIIARADADPNNKEIQEEAREDLRYIADTKYGHHRLVAVLDSQGGLDAAKRMLNEEDAIYRNIVGSTTSLKKATGADEDAQILKDWGESPSAAGGGGRGGGVFPTGGGGGVFGSPPARDDASETSPRAPETPSDPSDFNAKVRNSLHLTPDEERAADQSIGRAEPSSALANLEKGKQTIGKDFVRDKVTKAMAIKEAEAQRIADDNNIKPEDKAAALRKLNPYIGDTAANIANYTTRPADLPAKIRSYYTDLASKINPKYRESGYDEARGFYNKQSANYRILETVATVPQLAANVVSEMQNIPERQSITVAEIKRWWQTGQASHPEWNNLAHAWREYATAISAMETGATTARVTLVGRILDTTNTAYSTTALRESVILDTRLAASRASNAQLSFQDLGLKGLVPPFHENSWKGLDTITRMDTKYGAMPTDAPPELKAIGKAAPKDATYDRGQFKAITAADARKLDKSISDLENKQNRTQQEEEDLAKLLTMKRPMVNPLWSWEHF